MRFELVLALFLVSACSSSNTNTSPTSSGGSDAGGSGGSDAASGGSAGTSSGGSGGTSSGGTSSGGTDGGGVDADVDACPPLECGASCNLLTNECGHSIECGPCPNTLSCADNVCVQAAITLCGQCPSSHPNAIATIAKIGACAPPLACTSGGAPVNVCVMDASLFVEVTKGNCPADSKAAESVTDCDGNTSLVCMKN